MRQAIRRFPRLWRVSRLLRRWYHARRVAYPDWRPVLASNGHPLESARTRHGERPKVLFATAIGSYAHAVSLESALASALMLRDADVHVVLCDGVLPACAECEASLYPDLEAFANRGPANDLCRDCLWPAERVFRQIGVTIHHYSDLLASGEREESARLAREVPFAAIPAFQYEGLAIGEHAMAGALRFLAAGTLESEPQGEAILRRYFEAALLTAFVHRRLLRQHRFASVTVTHGIYVPWGVVGAVARQMGVRLAAWNVAYRKRRFIFSHGDTYHHTLMSEPTVEWEHVELTPQREQSLLEYLKSRRDGMFDWIVFHRANQHDPKAIARELGLDESRPIVGLLTSVSWDARLHYPANAFPNMLEWLVATCEYFATRPDLQLVIRVHPAEISGFPPSRQPILRELVRRVPHLSPNITVVPPESEIGTYPLMSLCNAVVIYGTKTGVELTSVGIPVIVAGEAWIRNKGITHDPRDPAEYTAILDRLPFTARMDHAALRRARQYAYHFFFRRMIPLPFVRPRPGFPIYTLQLSSLSELQPGAHGGLDVICDGILHGTPFVYDEAQA
ncbi:MAG: capsule biosynthesis protein [Acidobacteriota bacterium]